MLFNSAAYGLPAFDYPKDIKFLRYSDHAMSEAQNDRYGNYIDELPITINCSEAVLVEVEVVDNQVVKSIYRVNLNNRFDLCLVVIPNGAGFRVKTVWLNEVNDTHKSLNKSVYSKP